MLVRRAAAMLVACALWLAPSGALAWKITTHLFLAETALDAIDANGGVTIDVLDDAGSTVKTLGPYRVSPGLAQALKQQYRSIYLAGVVGPDAYPDIMTGQMNIHPPVAATLGGSEFGTDAFLHHLWNAVERESTNQLAKKAFVLGYLTHAAGDLFAHTFVNHFSGGAFHVGDNAARHVVMEGYIGKRAPRHRTRPALNGPVEDFIYRTLVRARPGSDLGNRLLRSPSHLTAQQKMLLEHLPPRYYSRLRNYLQSEIERYDKLPALHPERADFGLIQNYRKAWRANIDTGLREWVKLSHSIGGDVLWTYSENFENAKRKFERYGRVHLSAMNGVPRELGMAAQALEDAQEQILRTIGVTAVKEQMNDLARNTLDHMVRTATGVPLARYEEYVKNPGHFFDGLFANGPRPTRIPQFNQQELGLSAQGIEGPTWNWRNVPAAYNTVTLTKLLLLDRAEVNRFLDDLAMEVDPRELARANAREKAKQRARENAQKAGSSQPQAPDPKTPSRPELQPRPGRVPAPVPALPGLPGVRPRGEEEPADAEARERAIERAEAEGLEVEPAEEDIAAALAEIAGVRERGVEEEPELAVEWIEHEEQGDPWDALIEDDAEILEEEELGEERELQRLDEAEVTERSPHSRRSRYAPTLATPNVMLGFLQSIDFSNQWAANFDRNDRPNGSCKAGEHRMAVALHAEYFFAIFKDHKGIQRNCLRRVTP